MSIRISVRAEPHSLGEPIEVAVAISNDDDRVLALDDPRTSQSVTAHLLDSRTNEDMSYTMGKLDVTTFGEDQYALVIPKSEVVEIAPRAAFDFTTDANERLFLRPGTFQVFVTDDGDGGEVKSNELRLRIEITRESIPHLLALAQDMERDYGRREWAMDWLAKLYPAFRLELPPPDAQAASRERMEARNRAIYADFTAWWQENEHTPAVDALLQRLNS